MSLENKNGFIWMDGQMVPWAEAKVHCLSHTLHYGCGAFEGVRAYATPEGPMIFRLNEHTQRLFNSAKILGMSIPYTEKEIIDAQKAVLANNYLQSAYIRPLVYFGAEGLGLHSSQLSVHVLVAAWEWGAYLGEDNLKNGIKVCTSTLRRPHVESAFVKAKATGHYINSVLAIQEAKRYGCDEALILDHQGFVSEGSAENFFMIRKGVIYTPDSATPLEGITREAVCKIAQDLGFKVHARNITRDEVYIADELFFTGTAAEVTPIREVDGRIIGSGGRGPITEQIQRTFLSVVRGELPRYASWLTPVSVVEELSV